MTILEQAQRWMEEDPDPNTKAEVAALIQANDIPALTALFGTQLAFGTAGMRGKLGPGTAQINQAMVRKVTGGLATELQTNPPVGPTAKGVVVGRDMRHGSKQFAQDTTRVLAAAGIPVYRYPDLVHTPLVSYATRMLDVQAGVMVTASHNPPQDNGYKVFWSKGAQIIPPTDTNIAGHMAAQGSLTDIALADEDDPAITTIDPEMTSNYLQAIQDLLLPAQAYDGRTRGELLTIVYTAMHGVAGDIMMTVLDQAGFHDVHPVEEQFQPDPDFPTVAFPNPEEPGALDLALALAKRTDADLVLANDPDGDRIGVAIPTATGWRALSGDEIGTLIAYDILTSRISGPYSLLGGQGRCSTVPQTQAATAGHSALQSDTDPEKPAQTQTDSQVKAQAATQAQAQTPMVATTVVSSQLLGKLAAHFGAHYEETLTGFKWMAEAANQGDQHNRTMLLAYEQALGVSVGDIIRDKDGVSACVYIADMAERLKATGSSLAQLLNDIATQFGWHVTREANVHVTTDGPDLVTLMLAELRTNPPVEIGGSTVVSIADHEHGHTLHVPTGQTTPITLAPTKLLRFSMENGSRVMVRPSGTEPKIKFYAEVVQPVEGDPLQARDQAVEAVTELLDTFTRELMERVTKRCSS